MVGAKPGRTLAVVGVVLLAACGSGTGAVAMLFGRRGSSGNAPTTVSDVQLASPERRSPLAFTFRLTDAEGDVADSEFWYAVGDEPWKPMAAAHGDALETSPTGTVHRREWDFANQLPAGEGRTPDVRILVTVRGTAVQAVSTTFAAGNDPPTAQITAEPAGEVSGPAVVEVALADSGGDSVTVEVEYRRDGNGSGWRPATPLGSTLSGTAAPNGTTRLFVWDVQQDEPAAEFTARLRFTPFDGTAHGAPVETGPLTIDNNLAPVMLVGGRSFVADPDARRGIPVPFELQDPESDAVMLAWQWRTADGSFPALPDDPAQVIAILDDPALRDAYQVAQPFPVAEEGVVGESAPGALRLAEAADGRSLLWQESVVGRDLQVLRGSLVPSPVAAGWAVNPLSAPVAAVSTGSGETALVLDRPASGRWRLRELRLADGEITRSLAGGGDGDAEALAVFPDGALLVGVSTGGIWQLLRVEVADGSTSSWHVTDGTSKTGNMRGLCVATQTTALLSVADALVIVDSRNPSLHTERVVRAGLASPVGVVVDQRNPGIAYLAERDWVNPSSGQPEGRIVAVTLSRSLLTPLTVSGVTVRRPSSLAMSPERSHLWFLSDQVVGDGVEELNCVRVQGGGGGPAYTLAVLPESSAGIATGPHGLTLVADSGNDDLAVGGGVIQTRVVTSADAATRTVAVDAPFAPVLEPGQHWRITMGRDVPAGSASRRRTFVWDSSQAPPGEGVVLRCTPYDTDRGIATDTGVPRPVLGGLQVTPQFVGGPPANNGIRAVRLADLDRDGLPDLITANRSQNSLSVFFQRSPGVFATTPDRTITNLLLMSGPQDLAVLDVDGDGDLDLVSANGSSNNLTVALQTTPSNFLGLPLGMSANAPVALVPGDLNGDGREDFVCACGNGELRMFFQLVAGLFLVLPNRTLTDPNAVGPADVKLEDLDGDGDLDVVSSNRTSSTVTVFRQTSPGVFAQPASHVLGGPGVTDGAASLVLQDFDGDGRPDIAVASRNGNRISLFLQRVDGSFDSQPSAELGSSAGPVLPNSVAAVDVNQDGVADLAVADAAGTVLGFTWDPGAGAFRGKPQTLDQGTVLSSPTCIAGGDVDGDGRTDLAIANEGAADVALLLHAGPGVFRATAADVRLGSSLQTPGVTGAAVLDADGDGLLDLVLANPGNGTLTVHRQIAPSAFADEPVAVLGNATTTGATAVAAADLDGDGWPDLASANAAAGTLTVFLRAAGGGFASVPDAVLGTGSLQHPEHLVCADLDRDGDVDLACADSVQNRVLVFLQTAPGSFGTTPHLVLGTNAATAGVNTVVAADLDHDGDMDLACSSSGSGTVAVFFQTSPGAFAAVPDRLLGGPATTPQARALVAVRLNADANADLACVTGPGSAVALFRASGPGAWPANPTTMVGPEIQQPCALAAGDLDGDGMQDLVLGNRTTDRLASLVQIGNGTFPFPAIGFGGPGATADAAQIVLVDLDRDGDLDVVSVHPELDSVTVFFNAH